MSGFAEELAATLAPLGPLRWSRFFGGQALSLGGRQFAMLMKGVFHLRCDAAMAAELEALGAEPFSYATKLRRVTVTKYWTLPADLMEDEEALLSWARRGLAAARAAPKRG